MASIVIDCLCMRGTVLTLYPVIVTRSVAKKSALFFF